MAQTSYHRWTQAETEELTQDIKVQGIEVAVSNFEKKYSLPHNCVYNKAWNIINKLREQKTKSNVLDQPMQIDNLTSAKKIKTKSDSKIIVMLSKENQHLINLSFEDGRVIINYPTDCIVDVKMI